MPCDFIQLSFHCRCETEVGVYSPFVEGAGCLGSLERAGLRDGLRLHENKTTDMCRVREGKSGCDIKPVCLHLGRCKHAEKGEYKKGIFGVFTTSVWFW